MTLPVEPEPQTRLGDIDRDKRVCAADVDLVILFLKDEVDFNKSQYLAADINADSQITDHDLHLLYQMAYVDNSCPLSIDDAISDGDVNDDGDVTAADSLLALKLAVSTDSDPDSDEFIQADLNGDGRVTAADALGILRLAVGID